MRNAKAQDRYVLKGGSYDLRPYFTYHGFRYAEITVEKGNVDIEKCEGLAIYTDAELCGKFETSSPLINQIMQNSLWGMKGNVMYVPTDCPQRDERLGWLGDVGVIAKSLIYSFDCEKILSNYLSLIDEAIREDGAIPCIAPNAYGFLDNVIGASGWADAFFVILSDYYDFYHDKALVEKYLPVAQKFIDWVEKNSTNYRRNTYCFSDWLSVNADLKEGYGDVDFTVFDICFYGLDCLLMQKFCDVVGTDNGEYRKKHQRAKEYFLTNLRKGNTIVGEGKQTALMLAVNAGFLSLEDIKNQLVEDVEKNGMTSGFIGIKYLLPTLSDIGRADIAYKLIQNDKFPSWGYSVVNGATTIWERWDGYIQGKGVNSHGMNSFNHFAFGSCVEWFYGYVLGIRLTGENKVLVSPCIDKSNKVTFAQGYYNSKYGKIEVKWETSLKNGAMECVVCVKSPINIVVDYKFSGWNIKKREIIMEQRNFI